jgi:hypothetical protein
MANEKPLILKNGKKSQMESGVDTIDPVFLPPSSGGSFQKYFIASGETYSIPQYYSSVVTGPMDIEGIVVLDGRLEVL